MLKKVTLLIIILFITSMLIAKDDHDSASAASVSKISPLDHADSLKLATYEKSTKSGNHKFRVKSEHTEYILYLPKGFKRNKQYNVVIGLHGFLDSAISFGSLWKDLKNSGIIYVVPKSPFNLLKSSVATVAWGPFVTDKKVYSNKTYQEGEASVLATRNEMERLFKVKEIWLMGFSQGASFAYLIAFHHPELFDGINVMSGWYVESGFDQADYDKAKKLKILISHGTKDPVVSYQHSQDAVNTLTKAGLKVNFDTFNGGHVVSHTAVMKMKAWIIAGTEICP